MISKVRPDCIDRQFALDALEGDAPIGRLVDYLRLAAKSLREAKAAEPELSQYLPLILDRIAEVLDPKGTGDRYLKLSNRRSGGPKKSRGKLRRQRAKEILAAHLVELESGQMKARVSRVSEYTGVSRTRIYEALKRAGHLKESKLVRAIRTHLESPENWPNRRDLNLDDTTIQRIMKPDAP